MKRRLYSAAQGWWYVAGTVWAVIIVFSLVRGVAFYDNPRQVGIYPLFAQTGAAWVAGEPIYSSEPGLGVYRYSPLTAVLFAPLSLLPGPLGSGVLRLLSLVAFLGGLYWWSRTVVPTTLNQAQRAALFLFAVPLAFQALADVQTTGLAVGLMLLGTAAVGGHRPTVGVICLVLAAMIKAYPIALLLPLILMFPRALIWRSLVTLGAALALPFVLQHPAYVWQQYGDWLAYGLNARVGGAESHQLLDVRVPLELLDVTLSAHQYLLLEVATAALVGLLVVAARLARVERRALLMLTFGLSTCWMTVFGPATESQTYIVVAPIVAWVFLAVLIGAIPAGYRWVVIPIYILFGLTQFALWFPISGSFGELGPHAWAGLMLFGVLTALVCQQHGVPPPTAVAGGGPDAIVASLPE